MEAFSTKVEETVRTCSMNCCCTWIYFARLCSSCMKLDISSLDQQDKTKWKDLENVYSEVEKEFVYLYNDCYYEFTRSTLTCEQPLPTVDTKRPGTPATIFQTRS